MLLDSFDTCSLRDTDWAITALWLDFHKEPFDHMFTILKENVALSSGIEL